LELLIATRETASSPALPDYPPEIATMQMTRKTMRKRRLRSQDDRANDCSSILMPFLQNLKTYIFNKILTYISTAIQ